jgi:dihydrofolate reductase
MRKIIAQLFISLDGVTEAPETWHFDFWNDQMRDAVGRLLDRADTMLLGRATYEVFAATWPERGSDVLFADRINSLPKLVASRTLEHVGWNNSRLLSGDAAAELATIKTGPGGDIVLTGSPTLVRSLLAARVLDELNLLVHPVILGRGQRLFNQAIPKAALSLARAVVFETGVVDLTYTPAAVTTPDCVG